MAADRQPADAALPPAEPLKSRWLSLPPFLVGGVAATLCFAAAGLALWSFYENGLRLLKENLRDGLRAGAGVLAVSVDPELHRTFTDRSQEKTPEYAQAIARLEAVRQALQSSAPYRFVYTCVRRPDGIYFILDPTPEGDADHDGVEDKSHIGDFYPEANDRLKRVFDTGQADVDEEPVSDSWGSSLSGYAPVRDAAGQVVAVAGLDLELTEYTAEIARLQQVGLAGATGAAVLACLTGLVVKNYHHRLQGTMARMFTAMHQARAGERAKSEFLATVSHELRTPLNGIVGMVGLLQESPLNARQREQAEAVHRSGILLQLIIDDILDWSKIESGTLGLSPGAVNLQACLNEVGDWFRPLAADKGLKFEVLRGEGCPDWFLGDAQRLRQVLMHLAGNGVKFTHKGEVRVTVGHEAAESGGNLLVFRVRDTGIGIPAGLRERIFEPFSQGDSTTTRHYGGTGLGLAISRRLCHAMGGEILLRSEPGEGSEFILQIPCLPVEAPASPAPGNPESSLPSPASPATPFPGSGSSNGSGGGGATLAPMESADSSAGNPPTLIISPDRMLIQLAGAVFRRLQLPMEQRADLASAREFLAITPCRAVIADPGQLQGMEAGAAEALLPLRQAALQPLPFIALMDHHAAAPPPGFDTMICRRLKMEDLEAALRTTPGGRRV